jgi:hypothetical protein
VLTEGRVVFASGHGKRRWVKSLVSDENQVYAGRFP